MQASTALTFHDESSVAVLGNPHVCDNLSTFIARHRRREAQSPCPRCLVSSCSSGCPQLRASCRRTSALLTNLFLCFPLSLKLTISSPADDSTVAGSRPCLLATLLLTTVMLDPIQNAMASDVNCQMRSNSPKLPRPSRAAPSTLEVDSVRVRAFPVNEAVLIYHRNLSWKKILCEHDPSFS